jgi:hypothetical protein
MALITTKDGQVTETFFAGCVVATHTREERVMSDVYADVLRATVYNVETDTFEEVYVRAYFECDSGDRSAVVDATPEVRDLYEAHQAVEEAKQHLLEAQRCRARMLAALKAPAKGRKIKVVKGRKVAIGTVGECFYLREGDHGMRVGLKDTDGQVHWTAASNCEAVIG